MKKGKELKYDENEMFNSENLQQYDSEGQKYFLAYMLIKGYSYEINENKIIFKDITSESQVKKMIKNCNKESERYNLNIKSQCIREARVIGLEEYSKAIDNQLRSLNKKEKDIKER